jgi:hypothetical protein
MDISAVVVYCSFEADLIDRVVASLKDCKEVVIVCLSHTFSGTPDPEGWTKVKSLAAAYENVKPCLLQWVDKPVPARFWVNTMRQQGFAHATAEWLLFIDADEVIRDTTRFKEWFSTREDGVEAFKLANYWYFLSEHRRAKILEDSVVLVHRRCIHAEHFRKYDLEREYLFMAGRTRRNMVSSDNPLIDHFSWVRSKEILLKKCKSWTHKGEKDWKTLIETAFNEDIMTTPDFVHGYSFDIV